MTIGLGDILVFLVLLFILFSVQKISKNVEEQRKEQKKWYMNPWLITILGGLVVGLIILLITKFFF